MVLHWTSTLDRMILKLKRMILQKRIFAEVPVERKDPTAAFFDLIGTDRKKPSTSGIITDLELHTRIDDTIIPRVTSGSETDRRRDAWIPSERTRQVLIAVATAAPGTYVPDLNTLTLPGILLEEELGDAIGEAVSLCLGEAEAAQRRTLGANDVTQDEAGLRELVQMGAYRAAINLTGKLLSIYGQGRGRAGHPTKHSPHSLQLWFTRIALLVKSKAFNIAQAEAEPFGQLDKPDVFYQFYPDMYSGRSGSIASFSFRLLLAELPLHCGKPKESLTKLFSLLATIQKMLSNLRKKFCEDGNPMEISEEDQMDSIRLWSGRETRVIHSVINCAIAIKDYELAMELLGQLCQREGAPKHTLLSALGRLHLQIGDIAGAEVCFNEASQIGGPMGVRDIVDKGLLAIAQNNFDEAYTCFQQASNFEPSNVMILNNMGVCLLYGGRLKEAIAVLESAIASNHMQGLHESLILNLCTLYDMESSKGIMKKFALLRKISKYHADAPTTILEKLYG
ncbi:trafficking protein particle complex subunit 12 isoform X2 [Cylas formicarius]|uniref:trafficking protein particle complex subunit 12 isoform X2 n=1 Tax=Cylas formicarius TaxID=197179 RepID=UPI00295835F7|nr:trafficking protein particle complex subunit 12 isoform X2 [Cylas formicarius]